MALYGVILIAALVILPEGLFHYIERRYHQFDRDARV